MPTRDFNPQKYINSQRRKMGKINYEKTPHDLKDEVAHIDKCMAAYIRDRLHKRGWSVTKYFANLPRIAPTLSGRKNGYRRQMLCEMENGCYYKPMTTNFMMVFIKAFGEEYSDWCKFYYEHRKEFE